MITDSSRVVTPEMLEIAHGSMLNAYNIYKEVNTSTSLLTWEQARKRWYTFRALCSASGYAVL